MICTISSVLGKTHRKPFTIEKERLTGTNIKLISFLFGYGANVYVFSYEKEGSIRHTIIDSGDLYYQNDILSIFTDNDINPANIDMIIITHGHGDHYGLAYLLAKESGAKIIVHKNFRRIVEGDPGPEKKGWFEPPKVSQLKECNIEYQPQHERNGARIISGVAFPILAEPIKIGGSGQLEILACPTAIPTHSPDQIIVHYSSNNPTGLHDDTYTDSRLSDNILFSGDLWLMRGPLNNWGLRHLFRRIRIMRHRMKNSGWGKNIFRGDTREQDALAKEALKTGFSLIRVKPGHGDEFIGSRIIANTLFSRRDLIIKLGYSAKSHRSILKQRDLAARILALREQAYQIFVKELFLWKKLGYDTSEISALLVRIYKEQSGGSAAVRMDRKERREALKAILERLGDDEAEPADPRELAQATLVALQRVT